MAKRPSIDPQELSVDKPTRRTAAPEPAADKARINLYLTEETLEDLENAWFLWRKADKSVSKSIIVEAALELAMATQREELQRAVLLKASTRRR